MLIKITHIDDAETLGCNVPLNIGRGMWLVRARNTQDVRWVVGLLIRNGRAELISEI